MELETQIVDIADDTLDKLFDDTPSTTVTADTLIGAKKTDVEPIEEDDDDDEPAKPTKKDKKTPVAAKVERFDTIEEINIDDVEDEPTEDDEDEDEEDKEDKKAKAKESKVKEEPKEEGSGEVSSVLKSTVDYLVQSGLWQDFEGREDMEITEETYAKLVAEQDKLRVESMFGELVDSTGPFGKAIIDYVKSGGNPDEIIDLFKEQKAIEAISIDDIEGQKQLVKQYYTEVMGWKPEKADKHIAAWVLNGDLEDEAKDVKDMFSKYYEKEAENLNKEQAEYKRQQEEAERAFESNIRSTVKSRKDLTPTEQKMVEDYLLSYDQRLPNGNLVNKFYVNFAKMQANPEDYVDLVMFVMDKQKYNQKIATKEKTKATADAFKFIKGNGAVSTKKGTSYDSIKKNEKVSGFDWGIPTRK